jgi:transposase
MSKISRLEVIESGARRRWTSAEKLRIVAESCRAPRNTSATARRHGLSNGQLFTWRRQAREGKLTADTDAAGFVPALVVSEHPMADMPTDFSPHSSPPQSGRSEPAAGRMEIVLSGARRVIVGADVDGAALTRVIAALERR